MTADLETYGIQSAELINEVESLRRWKAEATEVLKGWDAVQKVMRDNMGILKVRMGNTFASSALRIISDLVQVKTMQAQSKPWTVGALHALASSLPAPTHSGQRHRFPLIPRSLSTAEYSEPARPKPEDVSYYFTTLTSEFTERGLVWKPDALPEITL